MALFKSLTYCQDKKHLRRASSLFLLLKILSGSVYAYADSVQPLTLQVVLETIEKNNPELAALKAKTEAASYDVTAEPILPPPVFEVSSMGEKGPLTSYGRMEISYRIKQELIFPTKFITKKNALTYEQESLEKRQKARHFELRADGKKAYAHYWRSKELLTLLEEKIQILEAHARRTRSTQIATKLQQGHLLAVETDVQMARAELEEAKQNLLTAQGSLNVLMGQDPLTELMPAMRPPGSLKVLPPLKAEEIAEFVDHHPKIQALNSEVQAADSRKSAAHSEYFPNFMVEYAVNQRFDYTPDNSQLMVGVTVPFLYFWQPRAMTQAAGRRMVEKESEIIQAKNEFRLNLLKEHSLLSALRARVDLYENKILPSAAKRKQISQGLALSGMESLDEHRESFEGEVNLRKKYVETFAHYIKALADYEYLTLQEGSP